MPMNIHGLCRTADGRVISTNSLDGLREEWEDPDSMVWIDAETDDIADVAELKSFVPDEEMLIEDCMMGEPRPRVEDFDGPLFLLFYGALGGADNEKFSPRRLAILVTERNLLTVRSQSFRGVIQVRARFSRYLEQAPDGGALFLASRIARTTAANYHIVLGAIERKIRLLEDESLEDDVSDAILSEVSEARRDLLEVRQAALPQRDLFRDLAEDEEYPQVPVAVARQFGRVGEQFAEVVADTDSLRERLREIRANYESQVAERTNEIVRVLTLLSGIMLPLTLIAGIYGMNVTLWPAAESPESFFVVLALMVVSGVACYAFFRRKRWL